ncbi:MAG TPA: hypothetical protein V6D15_09055 [Oculatellaceae cyanobacterium]|jgi:RecB family endonuclease NucS
MLDASALIKIDDKWNFTTETDLEDFIEKNLSSILSLIFLKRQDIAQGEICDILAVDNSQRLVIIELKNVVDRYIVQQLTRYYHNLLEEKSFPFEIDDQQPVRLIAIAPSFHRHNFIDKRYSKLDFDFFSFDITQQAKTLYFNLKTTDGVLVSQLKIPYLPEYIVDEIEIITPIINIPRPPRSLAKMLKDNLSEQQEKVLMIREKILSFDRRMAEKSTAVTTRYGLKKGDNELFASKLCAEFYGEFFKDNWHLFHLSLWLPFPKGKMNFQGKFRSEEKSLIKIDFYPKNINQPVERFCLNRNPKPHARSGDCHTIMFYWHIYEQMTGKIVRSTSIDTLIDIALEEWLERVDN